MDALDHNISDITKPCPRSYREWRWFRRHYDFQL